MTTVIETDETGRLVLPAELLGEVKSHTRYIVEAVGARLVLEPEARLSERQKVYEEWKQNWDNLTEQISDAWNTDKSAVEIVTEMRR